MNGSGHIFSSAGILYWFYFLKGGKTYTLDSDVYQPVDEGCSFTVKHGDNIPDSVCHHQKCEQQATAEQLRIR